MAVNSRNRKDLKPYTLEHIANQSFDQESQMSMVELTGYDPIANAIKKITVNALGEYATNDVDDQSEPNITYIGKEDPAADWYLQRIDTTSGTSIRYATVNNNGATSSYSDAWTNRVSLTYGTYSEAF
jgi:hypothetical protein